MINKIKFIIMHLSFIKIYSIFLKSFFNKITETRYNVRYNAGFDMDLLNCNAI
jgi:hypothetical protein